MDNKSKKRNSNNSYIPLNQYSYSQNNRGNLAPGIVQWIQKNRNNIQFDNRNNSENSKENFAQQAQQNRNNILQAFRNRRNEQRQNNEISRSSLNQFFRNEDRNNNLVNIDNQDLNNYVQNEANRIIQNQRNYYQSDEYRQRLNNAGVSLSNQNRLSNQLNSTNRPNISILSSEQFRDFHPNSSTIGSTHYRRTTGQSGQTYNPGIYFNRDYLRRQHQYDRIPEYIQHETSHWADRLTPDAQRYNESLIEGNLRPEVSEYRSNPREIRARGMVVLQNYLNNRNQYRDLDDYLDNSNDNSDALYDLRNNIFRDEQSMRNYLNHFVSNDITNQNGYQLYYAKKGGSITSTTYGTTYSDRSKLVSKNSVQRFKQGKKINFLQKGSNFLGQGIQKNWRGNKGQIDDDSWNSLIELGYTGERNALSAQKYLNSLGLGQQFGQRISEDNAWGNQSRYALNHFLQLKRTQTPQQIISINDYYKPLSEGSVQAVESTLPQNIQPTIAQSTVAQPTYNRKQVRERLRSLGFNPYSDFSGSDRKTLRKYWNGEISELPDNLHWVNFFLKQGGQLVSKNPVQRFKSNFRIVAQ